MHEDAMLRDLVRKAEEVARRQGPSTVVRVRLWVGARSHLAGPELPHRWTEATTGTALEGSAVEVDFSPDPNDPNADRIMLRSLDVETTEDRGTKR